MKNLTGAIITLCALSVGTAYADTQPQPLPSDHRIKQFVYDENTVYRLDLHLHAITSVQFARNEEVKSILIGDSVSFDVFRLKAGNVISIKPRVPEALSNLTIYSDKRVYTFELRTVGDIKRAHRSGQSQNYRTTFIYSDATEIREFEGGVGSGNDKNFDYFAAGESGFKPVEVFDNGRQTFFKFAPDAPRPAIFKVDSKGRESLVNLRANGSVTIVDSISDLWTIRIGDEALCVAKGSAIASLPYNLRKGANAQTLSANTDRFSSRASQRLHHER
ncbi:MAG: TrbG/VirB9 family P-type conjugative transfer protein [Pseudomonadota bacterium]